jgi:zinc transport system ATP-binding protein
MAYITVRDADFAWDGKTVLRDINFSVSRSDYLAIVGVNGSGKSTLIEGILGLKQPERGTVRRGDGLCQSDIGFLGQQKMAQKDFPASVWEVVLSGRQGRRGFRPFYSAEDKNSVLVNAQLFGVDHLLRKCYRELSGGQQQRVLFARALCAAKKLLVLDEPAAGLDPHGAADMYRVIRHLNREHGTAVIMVSHDLQSALAHANLVLHLDKTQVFFGPSAEWGGSIG